MSIEGNEHLLVHLEDAVLHLMLNRPDTLNAFSPEMVEGLTAAMESARHHPDIRVVVLSGAGRSFSAGGDVKTMGNQHEPLQVYNHIGKLNELILAMKNLDKPIIAAVHGFAAGAAFNLALACDLIFAAEDSRFVMSFSKVGLISDGGGQYFLPRLIGPYRAKELLFSAEPIEAKKAYDWGIVNHVYPADQLQDEVMHYARRLAAGPTVAYGFTKKIVDRALHATLEEILEQERIAQATIATTEDHQEGVHAFKEKRDPHFKGK
ncbi:MAG: enoyl-CoA hydratase [Bacillaceae bacterium]|nr:enoyl-CoA hydratase [Bacillaceae bacterium]